MSQVKERSWTNVKVVILMVVFSVFLVGSLARAGGTEYRGFPTVPIYVNGQLTSPSTPAILIDGSTYVPMRFMSEAADLKISWDANRSAVVLNTEQNAKVADSAPDLAWLPFPHADGEKVTWAYTRPGGSVTTDVTVDHLTFSGAFKNTSTFTVRVRLITVMGEDSQGVSVITTDSVYLDRTTVGPGQVVTYRAQVTMPHPAPQWAKAIPEITWDVVQGEAQ